jgi:hypothetical protein
VVIPTVITNSSLGPFRLPDPSIPKWPIRQANGLSNAQYGGVPSAPGAVGTHPFQTIALRKRRAIIT